VQVCPRRAYCYALTGHTKKKEENSMPAADWDIDAKLRDFERDGFVIFENAIDPAQVETIKQALLRVEREQDFGFRDTDFEGKRTVRIYNLLVHGPEFWEIPVHPTALAFAERVLDEELQLSSLSAITLSPGQGAQPVHADDQLIPVPKPHQAFTLNCVWAITEFTEENGATRLVPGSHKASGMPEYDIDCDTVPGVMPAGSLLFWHGSLWHAGGENRSNERRFAVANYYAAGFMRQQENQQLGIPLETARQFPKRLQQLCGYSVYRGLYGHVDNADPITLLGEDEGQKLIWQRTPEEMFADT
jgi:ectoine hydroxylase-related dioxygenase (phytanoyl-CoA dioxygenase family)